MFKATGAAVIFLCLASTANAQSNAETVAGLVKNFPRNDWGGAIYWFEMRTALGWEKMMLVMGYASNGPVCERLTNFARLDSPDREFRCTEAN